jgi:muramoyltetrapeptide carboxypeptidase
LRMDQGQSRIVRVISPSGPCSREKLMSSKAYLEGLGFSVQFGKNVFKKKPYLAGSDEERLDDLASALKDNEVDIIWFSRGGYGAMRLLAMLPAYTSKKEKTMIGYSDSTAIFSWASRFPKLRSLYGPSFSEIYDNTLTDLSSLWAAIDQRPFVLKGKKDVHKVKKIKIAGGCLSILSSLAGTPFFPDLEGRFLFLEDVNEPIYKIDRMLTHLFLAKAFEKAEGLILGSFEQIESSVYSRTADLLKEGKPVIRGINAGHIKHKRTLPFDREASWDGESLIFS